MFSAGEAGMTGLSGMSALVNGGVVTLLLDNFTDPNGTALTSHTMDVGPGWTALSAGGTVQSNKWAVAGMGDAYVSDSGHANVTVVATFNLGTADGNHICGLILRASDSSNFWFGWAAGDGTHYLYELNAGSFTQRASGSWTADTSDHSLTMTANGTVITSRIDSLTPLSYSSATLNQSVTTHGIRGYKSGGGTPTIDAFQVKL